MTTAAARAREARQEKELQALQAAERAEQLRAELTRARIDLEFFERGPARSTRQGASPPAPGGRRGRARRGGARTRGVAVGLWFVAFYLLLVALANGTPADAVTATSTGSDHRSASSVEVGAGVL